MQFSNRVWSAGRLFAIAACLVATYLLFAVTAMRVALRVREVPVPDLRNHTVAEATAQAAGRRPRAGRRRERPARSEDSCGPHRAAGAGAGAITRRQRSVRVWVSQGPRITVIPALTGESERAAQLRLQQDGLAVSVARRSAIVRFPERHRHRAGAARQRERHRGRAARQSRRAAATIT